MNSQFMGTGTHQLCFVDNNCTFSGVETPITAATIDIARGAGIVTAASAINDMPATNREALDYKLADAVQFGSVKSASADSNNEVYEQLRAEMVRQFKTMSN